MRLGNIPIFLLFSSSFPIRIRFCSSVLLSTFSVRNEHTLFSCVSRVYVFRCCFSSLRLVLYFGHCVSTCKRYHHSIIAALALSCRFLYMAGLAVLRHAVDDVRWRCGSVLLDELSRIVPVGSDAAWNSKVILIFLCIYFLIIKFIPSRILHGKEEWSLRVFPDLYIHWRCSRSLFGRAFYTTLEVS